MSRSTMPFRQKFLMGLLVSLAFGYGTLAPKPGWAQDVVERGNVVDLTPTDEISTDAITDLNARDDYDTSGLANSQPMPPALNENQQAEPVAKEADIAKTADGANAADVGGAIQLLDSKPPLRIGMVAERGPTYLQARIEPFRSYLQDTLSRPVEVIAFTSVKTLIAAHTANQVDYASYPASIFAMAQASCGCLSPLVAPVSEQAPEGIYMLMVVRASTGINSLADMTGRTLALSSKNAAVPFHMAINELRLSGLDPNRDLSSILRRENPAEALELLETGEVDAALVWSTTYFNQSLFDSTGAIAAYQKAKEAKRKKDQNEPDFISIWRSRPVPAGPHTVHNSLPKQDRADLIKALTRMNIQDPAAYDAIERFYGAGFRSVTLEDYAPLIDVATAR